MQTVTLARHAMATRFELVLHGNDPVALRAAGEAALDEVTRAESQLSLYRPGSEIAQVNARAAREAVHISPELFALLEQAQRLHAETQGAFDITVAPLVRCWGFMDNRGKMPSPEALADARTKVGMTLVRLDGCRRTVRLERDGMMLDLGAIGKGYAIERGAELLREAGVHSALFHGGTSTICAIGHPPKAETWSVAIEKPPAALGDVSFPDLPVAHLRDETLSISAVWGRHFQAGDKNFGHVIDPRTGQPVEQAWLSAVVLPHATETDALSTALLTLGSDGLARLSESRSALKALLVTRAGCLEANSAWRHSA
ncbi:MAG TPA: FAD:protein FMN transferase [Verrucomicrobiae bacterium]|nr:FAD:protein FMN transferase [Verrucomicrobiae bacterium]